MKQENLFDEDSRLTALLREWTTEEPLPPRFREGVWRKIERAEVSTEPGPSLRAWLAILLARPVYATAVAAILLAVGLAAGFWRADHDNARWDTELARNYMASVNPYAADHVRP